MSGESEPTKSPERIQPGARFYVLINTDHFDSAQALVDQLRGLPPVRLADVIPYSSQFKAAVVIEAGNFSEGADFIDNTIKLLEGVLGIAFFFADQPQPWTPPSAE